MKAIGVAMNRFKGLSAVLCVAALHFAHAERAPQDYWEYTGKAFGGTLNYSGMAIGEKTNLYTAYYLGGTTNVFLRHYRISAQGNSLALVRDTPLLRVTNNAFLGIGCDSGGSRYVFCATNRTWSVVQCYGSTGQLEFSWGAEGTNDGAFGAAPSGPASHYLSILDDEIYIADRANNRIQVFTTNGIFLRKWGSLGLLEGQFRSNSLAAVVASRNGKVFTLDGNGLQCFTTNGSFIRRITNAAGGMATTPDGLLACGKSVFDPSDFTSWSLLSNNASVGPIAFTERGDAFAANNGNVFTNVHILFLERQINDADNPLARKAIPHPLILSVAKRADQPFVDIDFRVTDADSTNVSTAIAAFEGGDRSLATMLPVRTWEGGCEGKIGSNVKANTAHRVTWNASADFSGDLGEFVFKLYSIDDRGLLPFHWITIPASGTNATVTVSARPLADGEMRSAWEWLVASLDPSVTLSNGQVIGASGAYAGRTLASDQGTTSDGRAFLMERLAVRAVTSEELQRAQGGNFGFESLSSESVAKLP